MNKNIFLLFAILLVVSRAQYTYSQDAGCATFDANSRCLTCKDRYYMYQLLSMCLPVSPLCKDYSLVDGSCLTCVTGFALTQGQCQPSVVLVPVVPKNQLNCATFNSATQLCQGCNTGYTVLSGACIVSISNCDMYSADAKCSKCATGYQLNGSTCAKIVVTAPIDVNCKTTDTVKCIQCKDGYLLTSQAACVRISPICAKYDLNGVCVECEPAFNLDTGKCLPKDSASTLKSLVFDPLCNRFEKGVCTKCSYGAYFDVKGVCRISNPLCKESDTNGACTVCYSGFELKDGSCILVVQDLDPNCNLFEGAKCLRCSFGAYFDVNGKCVVTDPNCKRFNNGVCESCYPGYVMNDQNKCIFDPDFNCADFSNGQCNRCSRGYYLDNGRCKLINTLCAKFDFLLKKCTTCYIGYALFQGQCTEYTKLADLTGYNVNCKQYDDAGKCIACFERYFMQYGTCVEVSPYCKTFNPVKGYCLSCYDGFHIDELGQCIVNN